MAAAAAPSGTCPMKGSGSCSSSGGCPLTRIGQAMIAVSMGGLTVYVARQMFDVMKLRMELFESEEFKAKPEYQVMSEKFKATFGQDMEGGYPDMGNGPIAALLPFEDWARFNIAQRTHYNTVESLAIFSGLLAANAQHQPFLAGACSVTFLIGRVLYSAGYKSKGPKGRYAGAIISDIGMLGLFLGTLYLAAQKSGLVCAVKKALKGSKA